MNYLQILRKLFLYAGVEKEEYNALSGAIRKENLVLLSVFSQLAGIMFFLLYIVSMLSQGFATVNSTTSIETTRRTQKRFRSMCRFQARGIRGSSTRPTRVRSKPSFCCSMHRSAPSTPPIVLRMMSSTSETR